jgi:hypothetical protein
MIEKLYEEVILEEGIKEWIKNHKDILKKFALEMGVIGTGLVSPAVMVSYMNDFLKANPEILLQHRELAGQALNNIAQFLANNPQILDWLRS